MTRADEINAALDDAEQSVLRKMAKASVKAGGPAHFFSDEDRFDQIPGGMVVRRNNTTKPLRPVPIPEPFEGMTPSQALRASASLVARLRRGA